MKIRTEIVDCEADEIVIRCRERNGRVMALEAAIEDAIRTRGDMALYIAGTEYYVRKEDILFFESSANKVYAHTALGMFTAPYKLFELEAIMPSSFVRVSKSVIVNVLMISSLKRELTGNGELTFKGSNKKTYFSRGYCKLLRNKIEETRF